MRNVKEIERAVNGLSEAEYVEFRHWFLERDWEEWDRQIRVDSDAGKLDFLIREAEEERASRTATSPGFFSTPPSESQPSVVTLQACRSILVSQDDGCGTGFGSERGS